MKQYQTQEDGSLLIDGMTIPANESNRLYSEALELVELGEAEILPYVAPKANPKDTRNLSLISIVHDFGDGRVIQVRPIDESNIRNQIERMARLGNEPQHWLMVDNTWHPITGEDLQTALESGQDQGAEVWAQYQVDLST